MKEVVKKVSKEEMVSDFLPKIAEEWFEKYGSGIYADANLVADIDDSDEVPVIDGDLWLIVYAESGRSWSLEIFNDELNEEDMQLPTGSDYVVEKDCITLGSDLHMYAEACIREEGYKIS